MSEYQYYEFQTIDRLLTEKEQQEVKGLSSHIDVTASRAMVNYSFGGGFRHEPRQVLAKYFDAFLYLANWGSRRLIFRFPKDLLEPDQIEPYCLDHFIELTVSGQYQLLEIELDEEEGFGWLEPEGNLSGLIQIRNDILEGDYRALYLAWLKAVTLNGPDLADDEPEPPVPAGLQKPAPALQRFVEFFDIDPHLVQSAAEASPAPTAAISDKALQQAIAQLPREESDAFLFRLAQNEPGLSLALRHRLQARIETPSPQAPHPRRRTVSQLSAAAERQRKQEELLQAEEAETRRIEGLKLLAKRETQAWPAVEALIQRGQSKAYDDAVAQLLQLRELAEFQHTQVEFKKRVSQLAKQFQSRHSFIERLQNAKLA